MKRFYDVVDIREVSHESGASGWPKGWPKAWQRAWQVTLDGRGLKTVSATPQIVPHKPLAHALAAEWRGQGEEIDPHSFPFRDMVDYTIDLVLPAPTQVAHKLVAYADTDTLLYRAGPDEPLHARQRDVWDPLVSAFEAREGVSLKPVSGVMHARQDERAMAKMRERLCALDPFMLTGVEAMTSLAASLITGLSAAEPDSDPLTLWRAASLEEEWQADQWGRDDEAEARRAKREADFLKARHLVQLAQG